MLFLKRNSFLYSAKSINFQLHLAKNKNFQMLNLSEVDEWIVIIV